jgi:hypothetical protein
MALNKHQILAAKDWNPIPVEVPEWGGEILIKVMSVREAIEFQEQRLEVKPGQIVALLVSKTVCDEDGKPLFSFSDLDALCEKNPDIILKVFYAAKKHNGLGDGEEPGDESKTEDSTEEPAKNG